MSEIRKNISIGLACTAGIGLLVWVLLFLHPSFGDSEQKLHVRFADIEKVTKGSRVTFAGKPVGHVVSITDVPRSLRPQNSEKAHAAPVYCYDVLIEIDSHVKVYDSDEVTLSTSGLMGERFVAITPKYAPNPRLLAKNDIIYAKELPTMADTIMEITHVASKTEETVVSIGEFLRDHQNDLKETFSSIREATKNLNTLLQTTNDAQVVQSFKTSSETLQQTLNTMTATLDDIQKKAIVQKLANTCENMEAITKTLNTPELQALLSSATNTAQNLEKTSRDLNATWPQVASAIDSFATLSSETTKTVADVRTLVSKLSEGQGSLGRLMVNDDFYFKTTALMGRMDTFLKDLNTYGILFHLNKGWQREQKEREYTIAKLKNPSQFNMFISNEMGKISTSLDRLKMAAEKAQGTEVQGSKDELVASLSSAVQEIGDLHSNLKNYCVAMADEDELK